LDIIQHSHVVEFSGRVMSVFFITEANNLVEYRPIDWWKASDKSIN